MQECERRALMMLWWLVLVLLIFCSCEVGQKGASDQGRLMILFW